MGITSLSTHPTDVMLSDGIFASMFSKVSDVRLTENALALPVQHRRYRNPLAACAQRKVYMESV